LNKLTKRTRNIVKRIREIQWITCGKRTNDIC